MPISPISKISNFKECNYMSYYGPDAEPEPKDIEDKDRDVLIDEN